MSEPLPSNSQPDDLLASHNYDGIQEYDNPTPGWWNWLFIGTIAFAPLYIFWYHSPVVNRDLVAQYQAEKDANLKLKFGELGDLELNRENMLKYLNDASWLEFGGNTFNTHCTKCHGANGAGMTAPNLTDDYYLHVKQIEDIAKVVRDGAKNGAMPPHAEKLHVNEILFVSCYVASIRGQNLESTRKVEGDQITSWPVAEAAPSDDDATETPEQVESDAA